ncbi:MAG: polyprenyl synthetase family protein [Patescibacteria group bacterium]|nr:polyprenyl synthetase family protein [Patescibacteria group bacterium]MDD5294321.1 polyprenyl synthetase family protein [Patescibacteria group bacterium]MDD5554144.1 polyprenyl synthetase family protein [Patescibacteria group bacterium]
MEFNKFYNIYRERVNHELEIFLNKKLRLAGKVNGDSKKLVSIVKEYTLRGKSKRIRALLVILGYKGYSGKGDKEIIKAAAGIELIHSYLLMHDDIIDQDDLRRNKPAVHKHFEEIGEKKFSQEKATHFGASMAIVAGDVANVLGYELLTNSKFPDHFKNKAIKQLNELLFFVTLGEGLDVYSGLSPRIDSKTIEKIYEYKTARYTFEQPLKIGALLAGAKEETLTPLSKFSIPLGIAFQIQDDALGLYGSEKSIGKPVGSDLKEGKKTLVISLALKRAFARDKKIIKGALGRKDLTLAEIKKIRNIIKTTGAYDYCQRLTGNYIRQSKEKLDSFNNFNIEVKKLLSNLADFIGQRTH